jgi:hypothetical protein
LAKSMLAASSSLLPYIVVGTDPVWFPVKLDHATKAAIT